MGQVVQQAPTLAAGAVAVKRRRSGHPAVPDFQLGSEMFAVGILNVKESSSTAT
jgi:hypothetical protein